VYRGRGPNIIFRAGDGGDVDLYTVYTVEPCLELLPEGELAVGGRLLAQLLPQLARVQHLAQGLLQHSQHPPTHPGKGLGHADHDG
jgi:hypothetical protein